MRFVNENGLLTLHVFDSRSKTPDVCQLHELGRILSPTVELILQAFKRKFASSSPNTQKNEAGKTLRPLGVFLAMRGMKGEVEVVPRDFSGWQLLLCDYTVWWLTRADSTASLATRCGVWAKQVKPFFEYLQAEGILPLGLVIPKLKLPKERVKFSPQKPKLLGEAPAEAVSGSHQVEKAPISKTMAGPIFWRGDSEYLDEIERTLRSRDAVLGTVLNDYWFKLMQDYRSGRHLKKQIIDSEWRKRVSSNDWIYGYLRKNGISFISGSKIIPLCSPQNPDGHIFLLCLLQHLLEVANKESDFSLSKIRKHPAVNSTCLKGNKHTPIAPLRQLTKLTEDQMSPLTIGALVWRFAGVLSRLDIAVAMAILIREHANVTPEAIAGAKLLNARGKSYLLLADEDSSTAIFSVNKPRAGCRKYLVLSKRSAHIVKHILRSTAPIRAFLKRADHPHWRYLFLGWQSENNLLGHPRTISASYLWSASNRLGLAYLYPCLAEAGLGAGTLDFAKIRATQGVLAWFDKGSVKAVHRRLGNSYRVSIEHYIPGALLAAWNERIIRRFQNTLLVLAAAEEKYLLDVVDMPNIDELHFFLAQLVYDMPAGRSPIGDRIQAQFGERFRIEESERPQCSNLAKPIQESLHVRVNPSSLALLLAYRQWANDRLSSELQRQPDSRTGLTPKHFIDLAGLLQAAAQSDQIGEDLSRSLDLKSLKKQYSKAESKVPHYVAQLNRKSLVFSGVGHE